MALTVGVQTVLDSREVVIVVTGQRKALALSKAIEVRSLHLVCGVTVGPECVGRITVGVHRGRLSERVGLLLACHGSISGIRLEAHILLLILLLNPLDVVVHHVNGVYR